jgi:hypothetical protein
MQKSADALTVSQCIRADGDCWISGDHRQS